MKKLIASCIVLTLAIAQTATALDIGLFGSRWNHKDGGAAFNVGILF